MEVERVRLLFSLVVILFLVLLIGENVGGRTVLRLKTCPTLRIQNGIVKPRSKGRVARFICFNGYKPYGDKSATCVGGHWEGRPPVCVRTGCVKLAPPTNGWLLSEMGGAVQSFVCITGYQLTGSALVYCNGLRWNGTTPTCEAESTEPDLSCDFETEGLCGWSQNPKNAIDWTRHRFSTPSGHVGTGPAHDHTRGQGQDGYYMYIETSGQRAVNGTAQLISPVYPSALSEDACFIFWYHMYGASIGSLNVYQRFESARISTPQLLFSRSGEKGAQWLKGLVQLNFTDSPFQVIVEAVPGRGYLGDTAIDDVMIANGSDCVEPPKQVTVLPAVSVTGGGPPLYDDAQSCRHRCTTDPGPPSLPSDDSTPETPVMVTCECHVTCMENGTCCPDYSSYCILDAQWQQPQTAAKASSTTSPSTIIGIVGGVALLLVAVSVISVTVIKRRRLTGRRRDLSDDSDVRFLTADEVLDFNIARPSDEDQDSGL